MRNKYTDNDVLGYILFGITVGFVIGMITADILAHFGVFSGCHT